MPPSRARFEGRTARFNVATIEDVDRGLQQLRVNLRNANPARAELLRDDVDALLDARHQLEAQ